MKSYISQRITSGLSFGILLIPFGILTSLLILEFFFRIYYSVGEHFLFGLSPRRTTLSFYENDIFGSALVPNQAGWFVPETKDYFTWVSINAHGWPDIEHALEKPGNTYRILLLGDSFVENFQVPFAKRFFRELQDRLGDKFEIIAIGRGNTGSAQQYLILKNYALKYKPDLVIQMFFEVNDVKNNSPVLQNGPYLPYFRLDENGNLVKIPHIKRSDRKLAKLKDLVKKFKLVEFMLSVRQNLMERKSARDNSYPIDYHVYDKNYSSEYESAWEVSKQLLIKTKEDVEATGAKYILVTIPGIEQVDISKQQDIIRQFPLMKNSVNFEKPENVLRDFCANQKLKCYFLLPYFRRANDKLYNYYEGHWNQTGTDLTAEFLIEMLSSLDYLTIR